MRGFESGADLDTDVDDLLPREPFFASEQIGERFAVDVFHRIIISVVVGPAFKQLDNMRIGKPPERFDFPLESCHESGFARHG